MALHMLQNYSHYHNCKDPHCNANQKTYQSIKTIFYQPYSTYNQLDLLPKFNTSKWKLITPKSKYPKVST